ncbi:MAG: N-acetylmuramoyl-L-alanine amidase [Actinobacteria bacterium]|nr:N-acetylmuramoyl-L-alanine amidase [Actinomycetota bacterium]
MPSRALGAAAVLALACALVVGVPDVSLGKAPRARVTARAASQGVTALMHPFDTIGMSWSSDGEAMVRTRRGATWTPWIQLVPDRDDGPDLDSPERGARISSHPVWVGRSDAYEVRHLRGGGARVHVVEEEPGARIQLRTTRAGANIARPAIQDRNVWLAREPTDSPSYGRVRMAFVHHTVSSNDYGPDDVPSMLRAMQAFHMDVNGWDDIGYNFLVDRFGRVWEGRAGGFDRSVIGAQTEGFNTVSTGVAVIGTFTDAAPSAASVDAVAGLLAWKLPAHGVDPAGRTEVVSRGNERYPDGTAVTLENVSGHRDAKPTSCPGAQLAARLPYIRNEASLGAAAATPYPLAFRGGVFMAVGQLDLDPEPELVTGADAGGGPHLRTFDPDGTPRSSSFVYTPGFHGGVRVATANVDGAPGDEIVVGAGAGGGPHVRVLYEAGIELASFMAYDPSFRGGVYVASGDLDSFPGDEIVVGLGPGGPPLVRIFRPDGRLLREFLAFDPAFRGGVRVATGDVDGDGKPEVIVGAGPGGGPMVRVFNDAGDAIAQWFAYAEAFRGGVYVSAVPSESGTGDWVVTGAGDGGGPQVRVFDAAGKPVAQFFSGRPSSTTGVRVAGAYFTGAQPGEVATAGGPGARPLVRLSRLDGSLIFFEPRPL